jgi:leucine dehydrogenase
MSYKNAMAGLPMGGGKAVILLDEQRTKTPAMLAAFGDAVEALGGRYVTAEDVGATEADMVACPAHRPCLRPAGGGRGQIGRRSGAVHRRGIYLGIKAAVAHKLGQGQPCGRACGGAGHRQRRRRGGPAAGCGRREADPGRHQRARAAALAGTGRGGGATDAIMATPATCSAPMRWARSSTMRASPRSTARSSRAARTTSSPGRAWRGAGRARHPLCARLCDQRRRDHLGGDRIPRPPRRARAGDWPRSTRWSRRFPAGSKAIWQESEATGVSSDVVADRMAQKLIGRG